MFLFGQVLESACWVLRLEWCLKHGISCAEVWGPTTLVQAATVAELVSAEALSCPEDAVSVLSSLTSGPYNLSASSSLIIPWPWTGVVAIYIPFVGSAP